MKQKFKEQFQCNYIQCLYTIHTDANTHLHVLIYGQTDSLGAKCVGKCEN